jgi:glycerophosphoryl diester phosphodiesterase
MIILAHRGFWTQSEEKNSAAAFNRSFENNFGVETDIRDSTEQIFISHDMAKGNEMTVKDFFKLYNRYDSRPPLALNVKADGLFKMMADLLPKNKIDNYFFFDMSLPDALGYVKEGLKIFSRQSEYEKDPYLYEEADGIWLDEFNRHWIDEEIIQQHFVGKKKVCIVSPELHKRNYKEEWEHYKYITYKFGLENLMLCTDYPLEAKTFFDS